MAERITRAEFARRSGVERAAVTRWIRQGRISPPGPDGKLDAEQAERERLLTESPLPHHQAAKAYHAQRAEQRRAERTAAASAANAAPQQPAPASAPQRAASDNPKPAPSQAPPAPASAAAGPTTSHSTDNLAGDSPTPTSALISKQGDISAALKLETWRLQKAKAEQANLAIDRDAGLLVERATVEYLLRDLGETIRAELTTFPDLHAPQLASARADSAALHRQLAEAIHATLERLADAFQRRTETLLPEILPERPPQPSHPEP